MLVILCLLWIWITFILFKCSNKMDKYILLIGLIGQILLLNGIFTNNNNMIELSHIFFWFVIISGTCFFKNKYNIIYIFISVLVTIITRLYYNDCLFLIANNNTTLFNYPDINLNKCCVFLILIILYRLY